jgi:hypothetical protein
MGGHVTIYLVDSRGVKIEVECQNITYRMLKMPGEANGWIAHEVGYSI